MTVTIKMFGGIQNQNLLSSQRSAACRSLLLLLCLSNLLHLKIALTLFITLILFAYILHLCCLFKWRLDGYDLENDLHTKNKVLDLDNAVLIQVQECSDLQLILYFKTSLVRSQRKQTASKRANDVIDQVAMEQDKPSTIKPIDPNKSVTLKK